MNRHLRRCAAAIGGSLAAAGLVATAVAAPAQGAGPWETYDSLHGNLSWTTLGQVAGQPGNAHTGNLVVDTEEGYEQFQIIDWRCPRGVRPPTGLDDSGPCVILRDRELFPVTGVSYSGPLAASLDGTWDLSDARFVDGQYDSTSYSHAVLDADVVRVGPLQRTDSTEVGDGVEHRRTIYTARMQLRGSVLDITLPNPRSPQSVSWTRTIDRYRDVT